MAQGHRKHSKLFYLQQYLNFKTFRYCKPPISSAIQEVLSIYSLACDFFKGLLPQHGTNIKEPAYLLKSTYFFPRGKKFTSGKLTDYKNFPPSFLPKRFSVRSINQNFISPPLIYTPLLLRPWSSSWFHVAFPPKKCNENRLHHEVVIRIVRASQQRKMLSISSFKSWQIPYQN